MFGVEDERADAAGARSLRIRAGEEEERAGEARGGDELLRSGDPPAVTVGLGLRAQRAGVRPRLGLRQRKGSDRLSARKRWHEARSLLVGTEVEDRQRDGARVDADGHPDSGVRPGQLLEDENVGQEIGPGPAVLLRHANAHQAELGELAEDLLREVVLAVPLCGVRLDLRGSELARDRLDIPLLRSELEVHQE